MSVINQMLKDLDQRQPNQTAQQTIALSVPQTSSKKMVLLAILVMVLLNLLGVFVWQLYSENQNLKNQQTIASEQMSLLTEHSAQTPSGSIAEKGTSQPVLPVEKQAAPELELKTVSAAGIQAQQQPRVQTQPNSKNDRLNELSQTGQSWSEANAILPRDLQTELLSPAATNQQNSEQLETVVVASQPSPASLTISRKQLSQAELISQKSQQAEQALSNNNITRAEQLYEEMLLISPGHKDARKQLAALWYGRQSYQPALNLLTQGIARDPQYSEFRLMKARIYLTQGDLEAAFQTLHAQPTVAHIEYQVLLANVSQQLTNFDATIAAYLNLTNLQPTQGRWWLGLAVALDSNSEFGKAVQAYKTALEQLDLSTSAADFARLRIQELGE